MIIPFEEEYRKKFYELEDQIFDSNFWSEGKMLQTFEEKFGKYVKLGAKAVSSGGAGLLAILDYIGVKGKEVLVPSNTFWADARAVKLAGGDPVQVGNRSVEVVAPVDGLSLCHAKVHALIELNVNHPFHLRFL